MCGIVGRWAPSVSSVRDEATLRAMVASMNHRGPDGSGLWIDGEAGIALGHARLAILDLSALGHQPMTSRCGRYLIVYNGEVYNYRSIAEQLEELGHEFRGGSDTEVILAAIAEWGVERAVERFVGMFAFAIWDRQERVLCLCRDRIGIKPLYYYWDGSSLAFASELKPLEACPDLDLELNRDSITLLLRHNYIPAPHSIYRNVKKLLPGRILRLEEDSFSTQTLPEPQPFWSAKSVVESRGGGAFQGSSEEAIDELEARLKDSIGMRMIADVPLGAFLSGGIDSSLVVALMQSLSSRPVKTFTIGFSESGFDEAIYAKDVARHLGTDHTELYLSAKEAQDVIPTLPHLYDEPFSDSSQIPTFLVSQLAKSQVTVSLSGDGGDELFAGYNRYEIGHRMWNRFRRIPAIGRRAIAAGLGLLSERQWDSVYGFVSPVLPSRLKMQMPGYRARKFSEVITVTDPATMYWKLLSHWEEPERLIAGATEPATCMTEPGDQLGDQIEDFRERMMYMDLIAYLQGDILTKVDRASMGVSLEARVPLIDHRIVEFAWSLPMDYKIRNGQGKWILRQVLQKHVPKKLIERPKMGFAIPIGDWLRGDLREWGEDLLNERSLEAGGVLNSGPIRKLWAEHQAGTADWQYLLWDVLMFQAWMKR